MRKYSNPIRLCYIALFFVFITGLFTGFGSLDRRYEHLVFQEANIKAIFQFISSEAKINIVVNPTVSASVTLDLKDITLQKVIDILLETYNLTMVQESNYYRVMTTDEYRNKQRNAMEYEKAKKDLIDLQTRVFQVENAKVTDLSAAIMQAMSHRGRVSMDNRSNSLVITDIPEQFPKIEQLLNKLDIPTKQVKISAKIMLVDQSFLRELGISWQASKAASNGEGVQDFGAQSQTNSVGSRIGNFTWGIMTGEYSLENTLSAILSKNYGKVIDQPDITTLDNKQAEIFSGEEIPVTSLDDAGIVVSKFYQIGTTLRITPHITINDRILLDVYVERNAYTPSAAGYSITKRYANTSVILGPNETAVIGGVSTQDVSNANRGIPILSDLPLIGRLFKYTSEDTRTNDLIIFITSEIIR
jgi:type IV pilus assembly protein PilQ